MRGALLAWSMGVAATALFLAVGSCGSPFTASGGGEGDGGTDGAGDRTTDDGPADVIVLPDVREEAPPKCSATPGFACVPEVPLGWNGPFELYVGQSPPPDCSQDPNFATISFTGYDGLNAGDPSCSCTCLSNVTCSTPDLLAFDNAACDEAGACAPQTLQPGVCQPLANAGCTTAYISAADSTPTGGCTGELDADIPAATWSNNVRACASSVDPSRSDCAAGHICQPSPTQGFAAQLCIAVSGDTANCPQDSPYNVRSVYYEGVTDTRNCSPCNCGSPAGVSCMAVFTEYTSCQDLTVQGTYTQPVGCDMVFSASDSIQLDIFGTGNGGACPPDGGAPEGTAMPSMGATFCCLAPQ